jgi:hypothetical protein
MTSRAARNFNPGNIRRGAHWRGLMAPDAMSPAQEAEHEFCVFLSAAWGFRAMALTLLNYEQDGIDTIDGVMSKWAPAVENNTVAYIQYVEAHTALHGAIDLRNYATMTKVVAAMAERESGSVWWEASDVEQGLSLAGMRSLEPTRGIPGPPAPQHRPA